MPRFGVYLVRFCGLISPKMALFIVTFCSGLREKRENGESPNWAGTILWKVPRFDVIFGITPLGVHILWAICPNVYFHRNFVLTPGEEAETRIVKFGRNVL